jgi:hypothetical protein
MREVATGVWFPFQASRVIFERMREADPSTGRLVIRSRFDYHTIKVTLDPTDFPEGLSTIELPEE